MEESKEKLKKEIERLKKEKNAIILAHNYQIEDVQLIADFLGDSLDLSRKAKETEANIIIFAGVYFMAETAKILSPHKKVLIPEKGARCPMADMVTAEELLKFKEKYPDAKIVAYVNTNADVKAVADVCVTSANAVDVVRKLDADRIIFVPDKNLANYVAKNVRDKEIIPWPGFCYVHRSFTATDVEASKEMYPDAVLLVHPECNPEVVEIADYVASTQGMINLAKKLPARRFLIATESGLVTRMQREIPEKEFYNAGLPKVCSDMKKINLKSIYYSLLEEKYEIEIPSDIMEKARLSLDRMLEYSK
ncbi:MAG TPA: quinolinate synthase NadA [candidate division WOR-3 bacterium]|uniref:Quinolinate synthase n=1 Tax=candidate division WOR-3 bacterium TaxID=2052148 RepID=A0A7V5HMN1_UNCW3|nr:quinolinate synthase NadA [candidate division WOR-3 bacterium]